MRRSTSAVPLQPIGSRFEPARARLLDSFRETVPPSRTREALRHGRHLRFQIARRIAIAFKETYGCDGTSTRQHNEPGGNQEVWHYHVHVFPRYEGDGLYGARRRRTTPDERLVYADRLRSWLSDR